MSGGLIERVRTAATIASCRPPTAAPRATGAGSTAWSSSASPAARARRRRRTWSPPCSRRRYRGSKSPGTHNAAHWVSRTVLGVRRDDGFCVQELGASGPGSLDDPIALVRPRVAVITNVGGDHRKAFRTLDATATEKAKLVAAVPVDGLAVLNADDPRVMAMAGSCRGRVLTYGLTPDAAVHAESVTSSWPDRLSFVAIHGEQRVVVHTRFCGVHWVHACLAAITTGVGFGIPLADAAAALADVEPWSGRLNPVEAGGVTFIRDECKASLWSIGPSLEFLRSARAPRKVAVIGTISDYGGRASAVYASVARQALEVADEVIFVGPQAHRCAAARAHPKGAALHAFLTARDAHRHLSDTLVPGDLVLLKGSQRADHLLRLVLARKSRIACWRTTCRRIKFCDECLLLRVPQLPWPATARRARGRAGRCVARRRSRSACWCRPTRPAGRRSRWRRIGCSPSRCSSADRCAGATVESGGREVTLLEVGRPKLTEPLCTRLFGELPPAESETSRSLRDPAEAAGAADLVVAEVHRWVAPRFRRAGWIVVPDQVRWQGELSALPAAGPCRTA